MKDAFFCIEALKYLRYTTGQECLNLAVLYINKDVEVNKLQNIKEFNETLERRIKLH